MNWFQTIVLKMFPPREDSSVITNKFDGRKELIKTVQHLIGAVSDGIAGKQTWDAIAKHLDCDANIFAIQRKLGVTPSGIDGNKTWDLIKEEIIKLQEAEAKDDTSDLLCGISKEAFKLIVYYESGGKSYYSRYLKSPSYPGGASGVTIGIGYDIGYNTLKQFETDWKPYLDRDTFAQLSAFLGQKGSKVKSSIPGLKDINISWDAAQAVFKKNTLPRFIKRTKTAFPGSEKLDPSVFGALVSIVFNRGGSMRGNTRREMVNIRNAITSGKYNEEELKIYISDQVRHMKRLWMNKGLDGLLTRRDAEADLMLS